MVRVCKKCNSTMHMIDSISANNAHFETWQCDTCNYKEKLCVGLE